jgi:hypothetical protein
LLESSLVSPKRYWTKLALLSKDLAPVVKVRARAQVRCDSARLGEHVHTAHAFHKYIAIHFGGLGFGAPVAGIINMYF